MIALKNSSLFRKGEKMEDGNRMSHKKKIKTEETKLKHEKREREEKRREEKRNIKSNEFSTSFSLGHFQDMCQEINLVI